MQKLFCELFFGLIAILMLSELAASNLFSLFFGIERAMEVMNLDEETSRKHFMRLIVLNAVPGISAAIVFHALRTGRATLLAKICVWTTTIGLLLYARYQYRFAAINFTDIRDVVQTVAVVYGLFAIICWFCGRDIRRAPLNE